MSHVTIIAEAGVNHNGDMSLARKLIDAAADAGADYVKFQTFDTASLVARSAPMAEYQKRNTGADHSQYEMLRRLELSHEQHLQLIDYCRRRGIRFLSTAFDIKSVDFLASLHLDLWKIPSGEVTNYPYLKRIAGYGGRVVMSTGMCDNADVEAALGVLNEGGIRNSHITLLHCNTQYPTPVDDVNLLAMPALGRDFGTCYGYSDHTEGLEVPLAATALGATVIEKHITLDRSLPGPDQKASLEPAELTAMVRQVRLIERALGSGVKQVTESERANIAVARKSIVAAKPIRRGDVLNDDNLGVKRPGTGLSPMLWPSVAGTRAIRDFDTDELIVI